MHLENGSFVIPWVHIDNALPFDSDDEQHNQDKQGYQFQCSVNLKEILNQL